MKAIIIAAGMGKRLMPYTEKLPKCMLKVGSKTILEWQLNALHAAGITNISVVRGYQAEKINAPGCKYFLNVRYKHNNILESLMCARDEIEGDVIIAYSDILYNPSVVSRLMSFSSEIAVVVDVAWKKQYENREGHPIREAENVFWKESACLVEIGKKMTRKSEAVGEFIGMIKLSGDGAKKFRKLYDQARQRFWGRPFITANTFENAYLTDIIQYMVNEEVAISCVPIKGGWREIDTVEDYKKACKEFDCGSLFSIT